MNQVKYMASEYSPLTGMNWRTPASVYTGLGDSIYTKEKAPLLDN